MIIDIFVIRLAAEEEHRSSDEHQEPYGLKRCLPPGRRLPDQHRLAKTVQQIQPPLRRSRHLVAKNLPRHPPHVEQALHRNLHFSDEPIPQRPLAHQPHHEAHARPPHGVLADRVVRDEIPPRIRPRLVVHVAFSGGFGVSLERELGVDFHAAGVSDIGEILG